MPSLYKVGVLYRNRGGQITRPWVVGPAYRSGIWPTAISWIQKSTKRSHSYNQGENLPSMEEGHDGGLPTTTVLSTVLAATVERSSSKMYKVQRWHVLSRAIRRKSRVTVHRHLVLFGLLLVSSLGK
jgi:hypothetical protein